MKDLHILAFTHRQLEVSQVGCLHIAEDKQVEALLALKKNLHLDELLFLSTCNRVEYVFFTEKEVDEEFISSFLNTLYPHFDDKQRDLFETSYEYYQEINAVKHFLKVAASIDSMVLGEREIITQVRKAFDLCRSWGLTGDHTRLLLRYTIETAKRIYTETNIAEKPVSVVALAFHQIKERELPLDARVVVVGAGVTNTNMLRFLKKHGYSNFHIYNRTLSKAQKLVEEVGGKAYALDDLPSHQKGMDILLTCTGAEEAIISPTIYKKLVGGENSQPKIVVDLAIPHDLDSRVNASFPVEHISIDFLQQLSKRNLKERTKEIIKAEHIIAEAVFAFRKLYQERQVELAMSEVPKKIKEIKATAMQHVFSNELASLDGTSRETLEKIIDYMEKKYISVPMKMAKEIILNK